MESQRYGSPETERKTKSVKKLKTKRKSNLTCMTSQARYKTKMMTTTEKKKD